MNETDPVQPGTPPEQNLPLTGELPVQLPTGEPVKDQPATGQPSTGQPLTGQPATQPKAGRLVFSFMANKDVNIPIIFAIVGFLFSILILNKGCVDTNGYHDIYLENKKELVVNAINKRIGDLAKFIDTVRKDSTIDSAKKQALLKKAVTSLGSSRSELNNLNYRNIDTSLNYYLRYLSADRRSLLDGINSMDIIKGKKKNSDGDTIISIQKWIRASIMDTCAVLSEMPVHTNVSLLLKQQTKSDQFSFFSDYPIFGFWYFFSIAQMTLWFLLIPVVIGIAKRADSETDILKFNTRNAVVFCLLPFAVVSLFAALFYWVIVDYQVISDNYFLDDYNAKMLWYGIPGYLVAIICFGVYLFLSNKWELLNEWSKRTQISTASDEELNKKYILLRSLFNAAFLCSAIILSVFVFWVGILFNSINSLEAMNFYYHLSGKTFLNYDFVYLLGLLHTLLLLIFYVPVHLRFNALNITQQHEKDIAANSTTAKKFGKGFFDILSTILVTTSPLLATILQKAIALLFPE